MPVMFTGTMSLEVQGDGRGGSHSVKRPESLCWACTVVLYVCCGAVDAVALANG